MKEREGFIMNYIYDRRCISGANRCLNNVLACEILAVSPDFGIEIRFPFGNQATRIYPSDFEIRQYTVGEYVDVIARTLNGAVRSAQLLGLTPPTFIPKN